MTAENKASFNFPFWLNSIPENWSLVPVKRVMSVVKEIPGPGRAESYDRLSLTMNGVLPRSKDDRDGLQPADFDSYQLLRPGQLVFKLIDLMNVATSRVGISEGTGLVSPAYIVTEIGPDVESRFAHYYFLDLYLRRIFNLLGSVGVRSSLGPKDLMTLQFVLPPLDEQRDIADYLDQETAQIDALVAKQEEFIGLLRERRTHAREVLASHVSTGPRLRWTLHEVDVRAGTRAIELPLFSVSIDWGVRRRDETTDKLSRAEELDHYKVCLKGDIVINRMRAFQGALGVAPADGVVSPDYAVLRAKHNVDSEWLAELMRTKAFVSEIIQRLRGIGGTSSGNVRTPRINTADLLDIRAHIPTAIVQQAELTTLTEEGKRIDALIAKAEEHIVLAKERRSALITAAVTGQFDVRTAKKGARV